MHVVIWTSKEQCYATPSSTVVEVIPMVQSRPIADGEAWLSGVFEYRGRLLSLIDSSRLLGHDASHLRMSTRILVVNTSEDPSKNRELVGLIVETVLACENLDVEEKGSQPLESPPESGFLGPLTQASVGLVQLAFPTRLPKPSVKVRGETNKTYNH